MSGDDQNIGHPIQRTDYDLSKDPREARAQGANAPVLSEDPADQRSPAAMMRQMGFDPTKDMTPLQFLVAVMNDDVDRIFKNEVRRQRMQKRGGVGLSYRIEAAKTAAKYMHMQMPAVTIAKSDQPGYGDALANAISAGDDRVRTKRVIIETVERISPDIPLAAANYPPAFVDAIEGDIIDNIAAEGDTDYDPDRDD